MSILLARILAQRRRKNRENALTLPVKYSTSRGQTKYVARHYPGRERETLEQLAAYQPIGRMGTADEVASLALYLCSDEAAFVTGQAYPIDGGVLVA
jgi:NAD(P)-dependent dehydrogenase (short-subunit alcohol dehydrogenase family)